MWGRKSLRSFQTLWQGGLDLADFSEFPLCLIRVCAWVVKQGAETRSIIPASPQMPCLGSLTIRTGTSVLPTTETHRGTGPRYKPVGPLTRQALEYWLFKLPMSLGCGLGPAVLIENSWQNNIWDKGKHNCSTWCRAGGPECRGVECSFFPNVPLLTSRDGFSRGAVWENNEWKSHCSGLMSFYGRKNRPAEYQCRCGRAPQTAFLAETQNSVDLSMHDVTSGTWLFSLDIISLRYIHSIAFWWCSHPFFLFSIYLLYGYTSLFYIHPLKDTWVVFIFWWMWIKLL